MPYKFETDKNKIPLENDRRVKLTLEERKQIKELYGKISQRKLAAKFNVSRRLIQFYGDPVKKERNLQLRLKNGGSMIYYDKDKNTKYMRSHRKYKKKLFDNGDLI